MNDDPKAAPSLADELTQRMNAMSMNAGDQKTSVEDEKDARTADEKAARIAAAEVEAASIRVMMNRAVEAVPHGGEGISDIALMDGMARDLRTVKAECLRLANIVDAVRALHYEQSNGVEMACYECGSPFPCPTVQALLEGEQ